MERPMNHEIDSPAVLQLGEAATGTIENEQTPAELLERM